MIATNRVGKKPTQQIKGNEMQQYVTLHPGRTPMANITDREDYKLDLSLKKFSEDQYSLKIRKYVPELGWRDFFVMISPEELEKIQTVLDVGATIGKRK
jgi:hypothetical protein